MGGGEEMKVVVEEWDWGRDGVPCWGRGGKGLSLGGNGGGLLFLSFLSSSRYHFHCGIITKIASALIYIHNHYIHHNYSNYFLPPTCHH